MKKGLIIPTIIVVIALLCSCGKTELLKIEYDDEATLREAKNYGSGEVMVLLSEFKTGNSFRGSLEPDSLYQDYKWVLVRGKLGGWKLRNRGYA